MALHVYCRALPTASKGLKFVDISEMLLGAKSKFLQEVCNPFKEIAELAGLNDKKLNCSKKMMCLTILS